MGFGCVRNGWNWRVTKGSEVGCVNRGTWLGAYLENRVFAGLFNF